MNHLPIFPILWPMIMALLLLIPTGKNYFLLQRFLMTIGTLGFLVIAAYSVYFTYHYGDVLYYLGNWPTGIAISLKLSTLSSGFLLLLGVLALACQQSFYLPISMVFRSNSGSPQPVVKDAYSPYLYPLFFFQLMGLAGAFLTHDIFNLFVFFEILLMSSYALLVSGTQKERIQSVMHYVLINLIGSALFLIGLALLYSSTGTLDMTDIVERFQSKEMAENPIGVTALSVLLIVFMLKAGIFPLHYWLVRTYSNAFPVIAALFAIMTKVGLFSILNLHGAILVGQPGQEPSHALPSLEWILLIAGSVSVVIACLGMLASVTLRNLISYSIICSMGVIMMTLSTMKAEALSAVLYYTLHSTLVTAGLFLLIALINQQRGPAQDRFVRARVMPQHNILMIVFFIFALMVVGLPPFSGFLAKVSLFTSVMDHKWSPVIWLAILISSFVALLAYSRAGTSLFFRTSGGNNHRDTDVTLSLGQSHGILVVIVALVILVVAAKPILSWSQKSSYSIIQYQPLVSSNDDQVHEHDINHRMVTENRINARSHYDG